MKVDGQLHGLDSSQLGKIALVLIS